MTPKNYTIHEPQLTLSPKLYKFHYKFSDLREFIKRGQEFGDAGQIITQGDGVWNKYRGYGTIENPCKKLLTFNMKTCYEFTGGSWNPDAIVNPKPVEWLNSFQLWIPKGKIMI